MEGSLLSKAWPLSFVALEIYLISLHQRVMGFWRNHGVVNEYKTGGRGYRLLSCLLSNCALMGMALYFEDLLSPHLWSGTMTAMFLS